MKKLSLFLLIAFTAVITAKAANETPILHVKDTLKTESQKIDSVQSCEDKIQLIATPQQGYHLGYWSLIINDSLNSASANLQIFKQDTITLARDTLVKIAKNKYEYSIYGSIKQNGTEFVLPDNAEFHFLANYDVNNISVYFKTDPEQGTCNKKSIDTLATGHITITATEQPCYKFKGWTIDSIGYTQVKSGTIDELDTLFIAIPDNDTLIAYNDTSMFDDTHKKWTRHYQPGKAVSYTFQDNLEANYIAKFGKKHTTVLANNEIVILKFKALFEYKKFTVTVATKQGDDGKNHGSVQISRPTVTPTP